MGSLSWQIDEGTAGEADLAGLRTVLAVRYDDDEPGSPWDFFLYIDERADQPQREALERIFLGRLGGTPGLQFPWVWKESRLLAVDRSRSRSITRRAAAGSAPAVRSQFASASRWPISKR